MKIFAFSSGAHDSSYSIYDGQEIICHEELERHTRIKECDGDILEFYLENGGSFEPFDIITSFPHGNSKWYPKSFHENQEVQSKYVSVGHHQSHAANAFFSSNIDESLIITIDGGGWDSINGRLTASTITAWEGKGTKVNPIHYSANNNLGMTWQDVTKEVFGMCGGGPPYGCQAGTVMAMAALGDKDSFPEINQSIFSSKFSGYSGLSQEGKFNFAARFQHLTEEFVKSLIGRFIGDHKNLCLSGGTVLNSVMTGKIWDWYPQLENIYIPPVPYDAGLSIGCIQYLLHHEHNEPRKKHVDNFSPYMGSKYSEQEVNDALSQYSCQYNKSIEDEYVAGLLCDGNIVSVFNEGSESGRRALGNRSILADPRGKNMKDTINEKVKHRQSFRPFAPSILREKVSDWFVRDVDSPYMQFVIPFKEEVKEKVPAVVHFDGTARLQTVTEKDNKWYYGFIKKFEEQSGVPIVLNTSFNDREPIVESPSHAIDCFLRTDIDYLYFPEHKILVNK